MDKDIGIGVIALGLGRQVLQVNGDNRSRMAVKGVCDLDEQKLADCAERHDVGFTTTDYRELLVRDDIQVMAVYSPDHLHCEQILAALEAGKHVVVTKPMVNTMDEAERAIDAARRSGKKLMIAETDRFVPEHMAAKALVDEGKLGEPIFVEKDYVHDMRPVLATPGRDWRSDPKKKGWLVGAACHAIDLVRWFGGNVEEVSAYANDKGVLDTRSGDSNFVLNLKFENGALGRVLALFGVVRPPDALGGFAFCGTKGSISGTRVSLDGPDGVTESDLEVEDEASAGHGGATARILAHLEDCIVDDRRPMLDAIEGAKTLAVSLAALESIETGRPVKVRTEF